MTKFDMHSLIKLSVSPCRVIGAVLLALVFAIGAMPAKAVNTDPKLLLIINSYHEDELWATRMSQPVELYLSKIDSVVSEQVYLNNSQVTDMATYDAMCDHIFERFADNHPSYVVLVGNFAFTLRDRIVKEWGDIPFVLISRINSYAPVEEYLANVDDSLNFKISEQQPLGQLRNDYNFSAVIVPDFYQANIDMMMGLIPDMKEFVFMSDKAYINKVAALELNSALKELYPNVKFRWLQASEANSWTMIDLLVKPQPQTGLLISSWVYEVQNTRGMGVLTTRDLGFLREAVNPVFTMRQLYMQMGSVGGAFADNDVMAQSIYTMVDSMIAGADMRKIHFAVPEKPLICANYDLMERYGLDIKDLPKGTVVLNRPETYLEKYWVISLLILLGLIIAIVIVSWRNKTQRRQIAVLQRHNDFINNMPMPYTKSILWLDNNDNVVNINYEIKNAAYEDLISKNSMPENPLHLFSNSYLTDIVHKIINTHEPVGINHHFKRSGTYCYFVFVPANINDLEARRKRRKGSDGRANITTKLEIDVFAIDVTKDQKMQQQLKDQAVTIDISMEMAQIVPWQWDIVTDTISFYTYRNYLNVPSMRTRDGKLTTTMKFEDFIKLMPHTDADELIKQHHKLLRGEVSRIDSEFRLYRMENSEQFEWCENHGVVTDTDSDGRPLRITGSVQFITERKLQEEKISQALTKAKESDMLKSAFLANMSHEIRTPLNAIVGFSNLLTNTDNIDERREFAEIINRNNELLLSLINDILDLAKIESNTITLTYDLCDIHDVVDSISKTVSIRVPKGVKLNVVHYADACVVKADAAHVSQVLINLLTNATKFTKRGSITVGYEIYEDESKIYFYVKDTGIGLSKENIEKVFNRFVKLNNFVQGSGLGLAICRTLVEKMGGEIGVESPGEGRGCTFWFTIPYDPMELKVEDQEIVHEAVPADHIVGEHADKPTMPEQSTFSFKNTGDISNQVMESIPDNLTVLVAEDNASNYWLMDRLMKDKYTLYHAENGKIALEMLDKVKPDIILMDINMPELDGYGAVAEMRKRGVDVPIIAVTAYAFASDRVRILSSGFDAFVSKPVSASLLYDTITEAWDRYKLKQEKKQHNKPTDHAQG